MWQNVIVKLKYLLIIDQLLFPANIYLLKINNKSTRKRCEISSKLTKKTAEQRRRRQFDVLLLTLLVSSVSIVDFEQLNVYWVPLSVISVIPLSLSYLFIIASLSLFVLIVITCSKWTIETLEKGVKYVHSKL